MAKSSMVGLARTSRPWSTLRRLPLSFALPPAFPGENQASCSAAMQCLPGALPDVRTKPCKKCCLRARTTSPPRTPGQLTRRRAAVAGYRPSGSSCLPGMSRFARRRQRVQPDPAGSRTRGGSRSAAEEPTHSQCCTTIPPPSRRHDSAPPCAAALLPARPSVPRPAPGGPSRR